MALQKNIASAPSITVWSVGVVIKLGATKTKNTRSSFRLPAFGMIEVLILLSMHNALRKIPNLICGSLMTINVQS